MNGWIDDGVVKDMVIGDVLQRSFPRLVPALILEFHSRQMRCSSLLGGCPAKSLVSMFLLGDLWEMPHAA